jgi:hypothetical protein
MANPSTLKDLAGQVRDLYHAARARAQQDLADAQKALAAAKQKQGDDTDKLTATRTAIAALRAQLATTESQADRDDLSEQIAEGQVNERAYLAALLDDGDDVAAAQAQADAATSFLNTMAAGLADADAAVGPAFDEHDRRQALKIAAVSPPLDTLAADVTAFKASDAFTTAKSRYEGLPTELQDAIAAAVDAENARRTAAADAADDASGLLRGALGAGGGPQGTIAAERIQLAAAEAALRDWAAAAQARYDAAVAAISVVSAGDNLLSQAEADALVDDPSDGATAAGKRQTREEKRETWVQKGYDYGSAVETYRAAHPSDDAVTVAGDSNVSTAAGHLATAKTALKSAADAYADSDRLDYGVWSGVITEATWRKLAAYLDARASLDALTTASGQVSTLVGNLTSAEAALAGTLWNAANYAVQVAWLQQEVAYRAAVAQRAATTRSSRLLAAVRGDA